MKQIDDVEQRNAALVRRYFDEVWNSGDVGVDRFFGDEFTNFGHTGADARHASEETKRLLHREVICGRFGTTH
jgi:hypothetical protein